MSSARYERVRPVRAEEIDELGHVNNVAWLDRVIALAQAHSVSAGLAFDDYVRIGGFLVVRRHVLDYLQSARPGDVLREETWLSRIHGARVIRHSRFWRESDGALVFEATTEWAWVEAGTLRARRLPREVLARFATLAEAPPPPVRPGGSVTDAA